MAEMFSPIECDEDGLRLLDQRRLPLEESWVRCASAEEVADAIREMVVRGAPAIGIAAAYGFAIGASRAAGRDAGGFERRLSEIGELLTHARPTAVNLRWAVERMRRVAERARAVGESPQRSAKRLEAEAKAIHVEDLAACMALGRHGIDLVPQRSTILTHCNAGGLATSGYGTALGIVRAAVAAGKQVRVFADETRPFLQGARLTAWELLRDGIETVLIADVAAGGLLHAGEIDLVIVGADRVAANGDVANKVGTYGVAVLAHENRVPFYVAAPTSTIDLDCPDGRSIPIEERSADEIVFWGGTRSAPVGVGVRNPAFDVTPARYVSAIVTERGIARAPYTETLAKICGASSDEAVWDL